MGYEVSNSVEREEFKLMDCILLYSQYELDHQHNKRKDIFRVEIK
jgi:hypothetical protein